MNFWLLAIPVGVLVMVFIYHLFAAPYRIYIDLYKEKEAVISDLRRQLEPHLKKSMSTLPLPILIELVQDHQVAGGCCRCGIAVHNKTITAITNVKVELISIYPVPSKPFDPKFPVDLSPKDKSRIINPNVKAYFDLLTIEVRPGQRRMILHDENGTPHAFEANLFKMLDILYGYTFELLVSCSKLPPIRKSCRLILKAESADVIGLNPMLGYTMTIEG